MAKISGIDIPELTFQEGSAPSTPASTKWKLYAKTTGLFYKDDAGAETGPLAAAVGGLGSWTNYTPTWTATTTNPTLGSTTIAGRYKLLDANTGIVVINITVTTGGAWNAGSGSYIFSLPSGWTAHASWRHQGVCHVRDSGTTHFSGTSHISAGATTIGECYIADSTGSKTLAHNNPVTWATGDEINITILVEIQ